jgi:hypothetical protein
MAETGMHSRFRESSVIHQTQLTQAVKHRLADFFRNPPLTQGTSQLNPAAWPRGEQPQANSLRLRRRTYNVAIRAVLYGRLAGDRTAVARRGSRRSPTSLGHQKSTGAGTV